LRRAQRARRRTYKRVLFAHGMGPSSRAPLLPSDMLRNVIGFIRPRSPSRSSSRSPSSVPNGHSDDEPWGDDDPRLRIHKAKPRAWTLLDFEWSIARARRRCVDVLRARGRSTDGVRATRARAFDVRAQGNANAFERPRVYMTIFLT